MPDKNFVICEKGTGKLLIAVQEIRGWFGTKWDKPIFRYANKSKPIFFKYKERAKEMEERLRNQGFEVYVRRPKHKELKKAAYGNTLPQK